MDALVLSEETAITSLFKCWCTNIQQACNSHVYSNSMSATMVTSQSVAKLTVFRCTRPTSYLQLSVWSWKWKLLNTASGRVSVYGDCTSFREIIPVAKLLR